MVVLSRLCRFWIIVFVSLSMLSFAASKVPALTGGVMDEVGVLSPVQKQQLDQKIMALEHELGSQLAVLIIPSTYGESIVDYGVNVMDRWQLGRKGVDDGLLLVVALEDRTMRIEVGYGLEGAIPDAIAMDIIDKEMVPAFRSGDYSSGIVKAVDRMIALVRGEQLPSQEEVPFIPVNSVTNEGVGMPFIIMLVVGLIVVIWLLDRLLGRKNKIVGEIQQNTSPHTLNVQPNYRTIKPSYNETSWQHHIRERREMRATAVQESKDEADTSSSKPNIAMMASRKKHTKELLRGDHKVVASFKKTPTVVSAHRTNPKEVDLTKVGLKHKIEQLEKWQKKPKSKTKKFFIGLAYATVIAIVMGVFFTVALESVKLGSMIGIGALIYNTILHGTSISEHKWLLAGLRATPSAIIIGVIVYIFISSSWGLSVGFGLWVLQSLLMGAGVTKNPITINVSSGSSSGSGGSSYSSSSSSSSSSDSRSGGGGSSGGGGASGSW